MVSWAMEITFLAHEGLMSVYFWSLGQHIKEGSLWSCLVQPLTSTTVGDNQVRRTFDYGHSYALQGVIIQYRISTVLANMNNQKMVICLHKEKKRKCYLKSFTDLLSGNEIMFARPLGKQVETISSKLSEHQK